ncbi:lipoprotein [gut metagenome]|uniref:Lipoprotein n=1 Tax=gut metagenome TaxID=749906 RepID=J9D4U4_9ZZZZ
MIKKIWAWLPVVVLVLLTGCRTAKQEEPSKGSAPGLSVKAVDNYKKKIVANWQRQACVTGKMQFVLQAKGKETKVGGQLRMKYGEVIQLSMAVLGFEVGRLEFTPQGVLIIDRVNKQYVRAAYTDLSFLRQARIDFNALQALFWNQLFYPGQRDVAAVLSRFRYEDAGNYAVLSLSDTPKLNYRFTTQTEEGLINRVEVSGKTGGKESLEWSYDRFVQLDGRFFPSVMQCRVKGLSQPVGFSLELSRLDNNGKWSTQTTVSSRYRERNAEELLQRLLSR